MCRSSGPNHASGRSEKETRTSRENRGSGRLSTVFALHALALLKEFIVKVSAFLEREMCHLTDVRRKHA